MYTGMSMAKYKKLMDKLYLNSPQHLCSLTVKAVVGANTYTKVIKNVPIIFDIEEINREVQQGATGVIWITRKYSIIVEKKYLEGQVLSTSGGLTMPLFIPYVLAGSDNGGYETTILLYSGGITPIDKEGYSLPTFKINYGDYSDGAYRQFLELTSIRTSASY